MDKKDKIITVLIGIVIVLVLVLLYVFVFKKVKDIDNSNNTEKKDIEKIAKEEFNKITSFTYPDGTHIFYNLENNDKLKASYENSKINRVDYNNDKCMETYYNGDAETNNKDCLIHYVNKSDFEASYKDLFGNEQIKYSVFNAVGLTNCSLNNDRIECYQILGGVEYGVTELLKLDIMENELLGKNDKKIDNLDYYNSLLVSDKLSDEDNNKMFEKYRDGVFTYKLIFDKNGDDYYISSVVKES